MQRMVHTQEKTTSAFSESAVSLSVSAWDPTTASTPNFSLRILAFSAERTMVVISKVAA